MIQFLKRLRTTWYVSSIISTLSFVVLTIAILYIWGLVDPNFKERTVGLGYLGFVYVSVVMAFLVSSLEAYVLAKDRKVYSVILTWLLITAIVHAFYFDIRLLF